MKLNPIIVDKFKNIINPQILIMPLLTDNHTYLLKTNLNSLYIIDPGEYNGKLHNAIKSSNAAEIFILNTHHHNDHIGGNDMIKAEFNNVKLAAASKDTYRIPNVDLQLQCGRVFNECSIFDLSGHTKHHIGFYFETLNCLFTGDAIFSLGCGRLFESCTPQMMLSTLNRVKQLPKDTHIFCGHEYTLHNGKFALQVNPSNEALSNRIKDVLLLRKQNKPSLPTKLSIEIDTNPFFRLNDEEIRQSIGLTNADSELAVFTKLRELRNSF